MMQFWVSIPMLYACSRWVPGLIASLSDSHQLVRLIAVENELLIFTQRLIGRMCRHR
jgi:hypothetical protein